MPRFCTQESGFFPLSPTGQSQHFWIYALCYSQPVSFFQKHSLLSSEVYVSLPVPNAFSICTIEDYWKFAYLSPFFCKREQGLNYEFGDGKTLFFLNFVVILVPLTRYHLTHSKHFFFFYLQLVGRVIYFIFLKTVYFMGKNMKKVHCLYTIHTICCNVQSKSDDKTDQRKHSLLTQKKASYKTLYKLYSAQTILDKNNKKIRA